MQTDTPSHGGPQPGRPEPKHPGYAPRGEKSSGASGWIASLLLIVAVVGGIIYWQKHQAALKAKQAAAGRPALPPVPISAGKAAQKDVPIYLDGLGTIQAFNSVTIRARVDGQLQKVAFTEGQDVHAGDLLAQIDPEPFKAQLAQNAAKKLQDEAQLANARLDLKREASLFAAKIDSQQLYDTQLTTVNQFEAAVKADQAAIDSAQVQLNYTTMVSPIDGRTGIRQIDQGNIIHANDANGLVVITQLKPISMVFTLPEQNLGKIQTEMAGGELKVFAMDRDNSTVLGEGKLAVIDNSIDTTTATIKLKATFANENLRLWPGQFVNARLLLTTRKDGIVVPASVIQRGPTGTYAFVFKDDLVAQIRPVKVAQIEAGEALIDEGLRPGEQVVVDGQYKLQAGSKVQPAEAGKSGKGGAPGKAGKPGGKPAAKEAAE